MKTHMGNRGTWNDARALAPATFPHADGERLDQAPDRCLKCVGPWHRVDEGYACLQCGRRWRAAACLRTLLGRMVYQDERWPTVRINPGQAKGRS